MYPLPAPPRFTSFYLPILATSRSSSSSKWKKFLTPATILEVHVTYIKFASKSSLPTGSSLHGWHREFIGFISIQLFTSRVFTASTLPRLNKIRVAGAQAQNTATRLQRLRSGADVAADGGWLSEQNACTAQKMICVPAGRCHLATQGGT